MLGEALGIKTTDSEELVRKLSEFHVEDIIAASSEIMKKQVRIQDKETLNFFLLIFLIWAIKFSIFMKIREKREDIIIFTWKVWYL